MRRPAPAVRARPSATCATISDDRSQSRPAISLRPPSLRVETRLVREETMAGMVPKMSPAANESSTEKVRTRRSTPASAARGTLLPMSRRTAGVARNASPQPARPPIALKARLSTSNWRTMRLRPAPNAERIAISRCRSRMRASIRFAMLPQAITNTSMAAPRMTRSAGRLSPSRAAIAVLVRAESCRVLVAGYSFARLAAIVFKSWSTCSTVTPGFIRPMTLRK